MRKSRCVDSIDLVVIFRNLDGPLSNGQTVSLTCVAPQFAERFSAHGFHPETSTPVILCGYLVYCTVHARIVRSGHCEVALEMSLFQNLRRVRICNLVVTHNLLCATRTLSTGKLPQPF